MKKTFNPFLQILAILWGGFITWKYFIYHPEYFGTKGIPSAFTTTSGIWTFLLLFLVTYVIWVIYRASYAERNLFHFEKLTPFKTFGIFSIILYIFANFWFLKFFAKDASFLTANLSLITKYATISSFLFSFTLISFALGKKILNITNTPTEESKLSDSIISIGLGLSALMFITFILGLFGKITPLALSLSILLILFFCYKETLLFLKRFFLETYEFSARYFSFRVFFLFSLGFILMLNCIDLMRPIPIGWDDMGVYLNYPKIIGNSGHILKGVTNNYFLIASWPFVFIKNEFISAMVGMNISFWGGILMLLALIAFVSRFFKKKYALMSASLMYILPMTLHQSFADMKTDMTLFFFMILSIYTFFNWFNQKEKNNKILILSGIFAGIAFGIKPTAIFLIFGLLIGLFYRFWSYKGALGIFLIEWIILRYSGALRLVNDFNPQILLGILITLGLSAFLFFFFANRQFKKLRQLSLSLSILLISITLAFAPWAIKNISEQNYKISISSILNGYNNQKATLDFKSIGIDSSKCGGTAHKEELDRYLGYDKGIGRYLSLPWKVTMNTTVHGFYLDLSFLFLSFAPFGLLLLYLRRKDENEEIQNWKILTLMGSASWIMWLFVGNGVIWYGIFGFILLLPLTAYFFYENKTLWLKVVTGGMVLLSILSVIALRSTKFGNQSTIRYAYGIQSGIQTLDTIVPDYRKISCIIIGNKWDDKQNKCIQTAHKELSPIYRIGTFIAYFIPNNNNRILNDPQLDKFKCIDDSFGNNDFTTMRKYKELGYKYFILDLNTATIEKNQKGSLHQKADRFVEWINNLNKSQKMYVHVYNPKRGIAFMELTPDETIDEEKEK